MLKKRHRVTTIVMNGMTRHGFAMEVNYSKEVARAASSTLMNTKDTEDGNA